MPCPSARYWQHPTRGLLQPAESIDAAQESGESAAERDALLALGADRAQGYSSSRPLPVSALLVERDVARA